LSIVKYLEKTKTGDVRRNVLQFVFKVTFIFCNYRRKSESSLFHIDLYRMKKTEEAFDIGIEEYLSGDYYCFIEWPGIISNLLPEGTLNVRIAVGDNEERILKLS